MMLNHKLFMLTTYKLVSFYDYDEENEKEEKDVEEFDEEDEDELSKREV